MPVCSPCEYLGRHCWRAPQFDFFPIQGARESFAEAKRLYQVSGVAEQIAMAEAAEKHGLSLPLRKTIYAFFDRWLAGHRVEAEATEYRVKPRPAKDLHVCQDGQVNVTLKSRHLFTVALEEFEIRQQPSRERHALAELLRLDPNDSNYRSIEIMSGDPRNDTLILLVNGSESPPWQEETTLLQALRRRGHAVVVIDPRGVGSIRGKLTVRNHDYADPLTGVEENFAYNAFLVGKSLVGMRVTDVQAAVQKLKTRTRPSRIVLCGRGDAALIACLAAAIEPSVTHVAMQQMPLTYRRYFDPVGRPINAASIVPSILRDYGDIGDILTAIAPRRMLCSGCIGETAQQLPTLHQADVLITKDPNLLTDWLKQ